MAVPLFICLFYIFTITCLSAATKTNTINITNIPTASSSSAILHDEDYLWQSRLNPLAITSRTRTRTRHLNSIPSTLIKIEFKYLLKLIFGKNKRPKVRLTKAKPPRFKFKRNEKKKNNRKKPDEKSSLIRIPLFPRGFGGYSMSLRFGTPPQTMDFAFDTASTVVWFPCANSYSCSNCSFPNIDPTKIRTFKPEKSASSMKSVYCRSEYCGWIMGPGIKSKWDDYAQDCPDYQNLYAAWSADGISIGSTSGHLLTEILEETVGDFLIGCSNSSTHQPMGGAGFGDAPESLPSQLVPTKFSYCLLSHVYDDTKESTGLILDFDDELEAEGLSYTPLIKGKSVNDGFHFYGYRYVNLLEIIVGDMHVKIPDKFLVISPDGNGGTLLDTGTPYTYMERSMYPNVTEAFESQMGRYARAPDIGVLGPCFQLIPNEDFVHYRALSLLFEGGAKMELSWMNYLLMDDKSNCVCLSFVTDNVGGIGLNIGLSGEPSIILGNYLLQSVYLEFDLENSRLGFLKQGCY